MRIDTSFPINSPSPVSVSDTLVSDRSVIAVSADAVKKTAAVSEGQDQTRNENALRDIVDHLNRAFQQFASNVSFSVDPETKKVVVKVVDQERNEVIYQFPTEEALHISASLAEFSGTLLDQKA